MAENSPLLGFGTNALIYSNNFQELDESDEEGVEDYKIGGYHPVHVGEILAQRYVVLQKLGWGHFSTVWLAKDLKYKCFVALKIQKSAKNYMEAAFDEVEMLEVLSTKWKTDKWIKSSSKYESEKYKGKQVDMDSCYCVQLLNSFVHFGQHGAHFVMVFEIMGVNLLEIIKRYNYRGIPIPLVKIISKQILIGLDYLHRICNIIHTDIKPENVLVCLTDNEVIEIAEKGQLNNKSQYIIPVTIVELDKPLPDKKIRKREKKKRQKERKKKMKQEEKLKHNNPDDENSKMIENKESKEEKNEKVTNSVNQKKNSNEVANKKSCKKEVKNSKQEKNEKDCTTPKKETEGKNAGKIERSSSESKHNYFKQPYPNPIKDTSDLNNAKNNFNQNIDNHNLNRGPKLDDKVRVKIADFGNGCWTYHHFSHEIQTRQYRSPEVIIGSYYGTSADIWSFACMIFELITGDFLFEPRKGQSYDKDDDHLAQMVEILGKAPVDLLLTGTNYRKFFSSQKCLRAIHGIKGWSLDKLLIQKYRIKEKEAKELSDFLIPMLEWNHNKRASAKEMLDHPWLKPNANEEYRMNEREYRQWCLTNSLEPEDNEEEIHIATIEDVDQYADMEDNSNDKESDIESDNDEIDPPSNKYGNNSFLLHNDHGPNPQFDV